MRCASSSTLIADELERLSIKIKLIIRSISKLEKIHAQHTQKKLFRLTKNYIGRDLIAASTKYRRNETIVSGVILHSWVFQSNKHG